MGKRIQDLVPALAIHPGEHVKDELKAMGISQAEMARKMGIQRSLLNEIIKGQRSLTAKHALLLEKALGIKAEFWMNIQTRYELNKARIEEDLRQREEAMEQWSMVKDYVAVKYYRKQKVLTGDPVQDMAMVQQIFNTVDVEEIRAEYGEPAFARFRKSEKLKVDKVNVLGWSKLAEFNARSEEVSEFRTDSWDELESALRDVIRKNKDVKSKVKDILSNYGIKLIYQDKADKAPIDGYAFWSGDNPAIAMTMRHKRLDYFAFTLYHELGHVFLHLLNDKSREVVDLYLYDKEHKESKDEREADAFAENALIPPIAWEKMEAKRRFKDSEIRRLAAEINIHPSIVLGRICYSKNDYKVKTLIEREIG